MHTDIKTHEATARLQQELSVNKEIADKLMFKYTEKQKLVYMLDSIFKANVL